MEDGMWVVVSNCDTDKRFWTLINFKLYQLKLEARVHPNYRLFIIISQKSVDVIPKYVLLNFHQYIQKAFISSFVFQHSFLVCLEPPKSADDHINILASAATDDTDKVLKIAAVHAFIKQAHIINSISDEDYMVRFVLKNSMNAYNYIHAFFRLPSW